MIRAGQLAAAEARAVPKARATIAMTGLLKLI
jgi:hypothetical protein